MFSNATAINVYCASFNSVCINVYRCLVIFMFRGPQGRIADAANCVTLLKHCINKK